MKQFKNLTILAIETSCDDTGVAVARTFGKKGTKFDILSNVVSSQAEIHKKWGGVWPTLAKREHQRNLLPVLIQALKESKLLKISNSQFPISNEIPNPKSQTLKKILEREKNLFKNLEKFLRKYKKSDINLISVTNGPGLEPCLWVGVNFAKALSCFWNIPVVPVNLIESHILVNLLENKNINFPAVALVVSGGHTQIILVNGIGKYKILGETRDDAAGECFDKCAKILGLGYPGGPAIAAKAAQLPENSSREASRELFSGKLPRPMMNTKDYDFSFSGLKTAVLYAWQKIDKKDLPRDERQRILRGMAAEIQQSIIDVLIKKTIKAAKDYKAKTIILGGGVAANEELRKQFKEKVSNLLPFTSCLMPEPKFCTDNAVMTAVAGYFRWSSGTRPAESGTRPAESGTRPAESGKTEEWQKVKADSNLKI